jgi:hypothetical protein
MRVAFEALDHFEIVEAYNRAPLYGNGLLEPREQ